MTEEQLNLLGDYEQSDAFDEREKALLSLADELTRTPHVSGEVASRVREFLSEQEFVELTVTVATANLSSRINNGLKILPD